MSRLFRVAIRVFVLLVVGSTLFGFGSAVVAAVARRRIETTEDPESNEPTTASVFAGERFESRATSLRGGRVITWFAAHEVDLRGATLDPAGATLDVRTMYGGTQITVPNGWRIQSHLLPIFGGTEIDIDEAHLPADAPLLELRGFSLFGGVQVTTSPTSSWVGADHDREALPPAGEASDPAAATLDTAAGASDTAAGASDPAAAAAVPG
jgi:hypothetical protein